MNGDSKSMANAHGYYTIIELELQLAELAPAIPRELDLRELLPTEVQLMQFYHRAESLWEAAGCPPSAQRERVSRMFLEWLAERGETH